MYRDFKELLSALNANEVVYLIIGGYAVGFHAQPRATKDLDLFVKADVANARALLAALRDFGAPVSGFTAADLVEEGKFFRFGRPPIAVDILSTIDGVSFDEAWRNRISKIVDPDTGLEAMVISRGDLIKAKLAAGRPQDLADVDALRNAEKATKRGATRKARTAKRRPSKKRK